MLLRLDERSGDPIYVQIVDAVRAQITNGDVPPGERLPTARDLAAALGVHMHTVLRAYALLRDEGLVDLRRRHGAVVCGAGALTEAPASVVRLARKLADAAREQGMSKRDAIALVERLWETK